MGGGGGEFKRKSENLSDALVLRRKRGKKVKSKILTYCS